MYKYCQIDTYTVYDVRPRSSEENCFQTSHDIEHQQLQKNWEDRRRNIWSCLQSKGNTCKFLNQKLFYRRIRVGFISPRASFAQAAEMKLLGKWSSGEMKLLRKWSLPVLYGRIFHQDILMLFRQSTSLISWPRHSVTDPDSWVKD